MNDSASTALNLPSIHAALQQVESVIMQHVTGDHPIIRDTALPFLKNGGKRLRPVLTLLTARIVGAITPDALRYAAVVELIHNASLFHDDVLDDANTRRGHESANTALGNHLAVLAGDFLYTKALTMVIHDHQDIRTDINQCVITMIEGEILQATHRNNVHIARSMYMDIVRRKTAALMSLSCGLGAAGSADSGATHRFRRFGDLIGTAFQLIDDLLDWKASETVLGKPTLQDIREGRITLPALLLLDELHGAEQDRFKMLLAQPAGPDLDQDLAPYIDLMDQSGVFQTIRQQARSLSENALMLLNDFPDSQALRDMKNLVLFLIHREY